MKLERLFRVKDIVTGEWFWISKCNQNGPLVTYPQPPDISLYYLKDYYSFKAASCGLLGESRKLYKRLLDLLRKNMLAEWYGYLPAGKKSNIFRKIIFFPFKEVMLKYPPRISPGGKLLDVGCGNGSYLMDCKRLGWDVYGVEVNEKVATELKNMGLKILTGDFERMALAGSEYDVVTFWHTLEHLYDPFKSLKKTHSILKPDGIVMIEVPNAASLERRIFGRRWVLWDVPRHLYHFSPKDLVKLLKDSGFKIKKIHYSLDMYDLPRSIQNIIPWQRPKVLFDPDRLRWLTKCLLLPLALFLSAMGWSEKFLVIARK